MAQSSTGGLPSAEDVGHAFINQYYTVLHQSPQEMHRFYTNSSWFTHAELGSEGRIFIAQSAIHDKFMSLDYKDFKTEIKTMDSQESVDGGVLVMVTGFLIAKSGSKLKFVQSFVLARQEKGYYVRNDVFRVLEEQTLSKPSATGHNEVADVPPQALVAPEPVYEPSYPTEEEILQPDFIKESSKILDEEQTTQEIYDLRERVEVSDPEDYVEQEEDTLHLEPLESPSTLPATSPREVLVPQFEENLADAPKKSYASILRLTKGSSGTSGLNQNATTAKFVPVERAAVPFTPTPSQPTLTLPVQESTDDGLIVEAEGEVRSIYVKNLPFSVTAAQLTDEFSKFGLIKSGGVNIRSVKGFCYAFVEFEDPSSAHSAVEASPILIGGRQAYVEEKRQPGARASQGRTSLGRGDRTRRASTSSRGLGRSVGQDRDRGAFRGRGTSNRSGFTGSASSQFANGFASSATSDLKGRTEYQGGNSARFPRRPAAKSGSAVAAA